MPDGGQDTGSVEDASPPAHVEGTRKGEEVVQQEGEEPSHVETEGSGARPGGGRAAYDPMRVGQDREGMAERGTVDPDAPDPSGGPNT